MSESSAEGRRRGGNLREMRLRHAAHYIERVAQADREYMAGRQQEALAQFDCEKGQLDTVRAWLWVQPPDMIVDTLLIAEAHATQHIGEIRDSVRSVRALQQEYAIAASQRQGDLRAKGRFLGNLGYVYLFLGDSQTSIYCYKQWIAIARDLEDRCMEGYALGNMGLLYAVIGNFNDAIDCMQQDLVISHDYGNFHGECTALCNLGSVYADIGETRMAITYYEQSLSIAKRIGDIYAEGMALSNLGGAYTDLGEPDIAIGYLEQDLAINRMFGDRRGEGITLGNLGDAYEELGEFDIAITYHNQRLAIAREMGDRHGECYALANLGATHYLARNISKAVICCETAYTLTQEIRNRLIEGVVLRELANAQNSLGQQVEALTNYAASLIILDDLGNHAELARTRWAYGQFLTRQGDRDRGIALMAECIAYEQRIGHAKAAEHTALVEHLRAGGELPEKP